MIPKGIASKGAQVFVYDMSGRLLHQLNLQSNSARLDLTDKVPLRTLPARSTQCSGRARRCSQNKRPIIPYSYAGRAAKLSVRPAFFPVPKINNMIKRSILLSLYLTLSYCFSSAPRCKEGFSVVNWI